MQKQASREDVRQFLQDFMIKMKTWDVLYRDDRGKNLQTLLSLEITPAYRKKVLESLVTCGYLEKQLKRKRYILRLHLVYSEVPLSVFPFTLQNTQ